jgi:L-threonylcarbamoyladenylate synthase
MKARIVQMTEEKLNREALQEAGEILKAGGLVAFPTETVYGLGGNALDPEASKKIYAAKGRPSDNPLIVHIADMASLSAIVTELPEPALRLAGEYWPGPLTMILRKSSRVPLETTGGLDTVAVRFPSNRIARELIRCAGGYVAAPSANTSGRPSPTLAAHVAEDLGDRIDMIIDGGPVEIGLESTIVDFTEERPVILRPGYLNRRMLEQVLGDVEVDPGILSEDSHVRPKAPGMRYRHYAPQAELAIVEGPEKAVAEKIRKLVREKISGGYRVGVICAEESADQYPEGEVRCIGQRAEEETIARHLYEVLREFDASGVEYIYSESFYTPRMGQAIMNRLLKAAGHEVIRVQ